jgi:hypothetical protein
MYTLEESFEAVATKLRDVITPKNSADSIAYQVRVIQCHYALEGSTFAADHERWSYLLRCEYFNAPYSEPVWYVALTYRDERGQSTHIFHHLSEHAARRYFHNLNKPQNSLL